MAATQLDSLCPYSYVKCVIVGDKRVGKTSFVAACVNETIDEEYLNRYDPQLEIPVEVDDRTYLVDLIDTPSGSDPQSLRSIRYKKAHVVCICVSVADWTTVQAVENEWIPEINDNCPDVPIILIGNKIDQRSDESTQRRVSGFNEVMLGKEIAKDIIKRNGIHSYLECSSITKEGIPSVLPEIVHAYLSSPDIVPTVPSQPESVPVSVTRVHRSSTNTQQPKKKSFCTIS